MSSAETVQLGLAHFPDATAGENLGLMTHWQWELLPPDGLLLDEVRNAENLIPQITLFHVGGDTAVYRHAQAQALRAYLLNRGDLFLPDPVSLPAFSDMDLVNYRPRVDQDKYQNWEALIEQAGLLAALVDLVARSRRIIDTLPDEAVFSSRKSGHAFYCVGPAPEAMEHREGEIVSGVLTGLGTPRWEMACEADALALQSAYSRPYYAADAIRVTVPLFLHICEMCGVPTNL